MLEQQDIQNMLIELGAPVNLKGFAYTIEAIHQYQHGILMTKELYPRIAKMFQTTPARVERNIRNIVNHIFKRIDPDEIYRVFGNIPSYESGKPTNTEFISLIKLRLEQRENHVKHTVSVFPTT